jgi:chaperonin GroES
VLIRPDAAEATQGGIILPEAAQKKPQRGTVVAAGPGRRLKDGKLVFSGLEAGDRVVYAKWGGTEVRVDGEELLIMGSDQIYGKIVG